MAGYQRIRRRSSPYLMLERLGWQGSAWRDRITVRIDQNKIMPYGFSSRGPELVTGNYNSGAFRPEGVPGDEEPNYITCGDDCTKCSHQGFTIRASIGVPVIYRAET